MGVINQQKINQFIKNMKYIYTWHEDTQMYSIRVATEQEENRINTALSLLKQCREVYNSIIRDANREYNGNLDLFIDNEAYYCVQELHHSLDLVNELSKGLIELNTGKYYFLMWQYLLNINSSKNNKNYEQTNAN